MTEVREKAPSYQRYPKQILGDDKVMLMDWDTVGMHNWLLDIAWQQDQRGTIPDDEEVLRKWLKNPTDATWERVWKQLKPSWPVVAEGLRGNMGMIAVSIKQENYSKANRDKKNKPSTKAPVVCESLPEQNTHKSIEDEEEVEEPVLVVALEVQNPLIAICEEIYRAYPKKVNPRKAREAIEKAIRRRMKVQECSDVDAAQYIHEATLEYARSPSAIRDGPRWKFVPYPASWFNADGFDDDRSEWYRSGHGQVSKAGERTTNNLASIEKGFGFSGPEISGGSRDLSHRTDAASDGLVERIAEFLDGERD